MKKAIRIIHILNIIVFWVMGLHMALDLVTGFFFSAAVFPSYAYLPAAAVLTGTELFLRGLSASGKTDRVVRIAAGSLLVLAPVCLLVCVLFFLVNPYFAASAVLTVLAAMDYLVMLLAAIAVFCLIRRLVKGAAGIDRVSAILHLLLLAGLLVVLISGWNIYESLAGPVMVLEVPRFHLALTCYIPLAGIVNIGLWFARQVQETFRLMKSQS